MMHVITDRQIVYVCGMRLCVMHVRRRNKCWKSCADRTLLRYASAITTCFKLRATTPNNTQQHATGCANVRNM